MRRDVSGTHRHRLGTFAPGIRARVGAADLVRATLVANRTGISPQSKFRSKCPIRPRTRASRCPGVRPAWCPAIVTLSGSWPPSLDFLRALRTCSPSVSSFVLIEEYRFRSSEGLEELIPLDVLEPSRGLPEAVWFEARLHGWLFRRDVVAVFSSRRSMLPMGSKLRLGKIRRRLAQNFVGLTQSTDFPSKHLDPIALGSRLVRPRSLLPLGLAHPFAEGLRRAADLGGDRTDRRPSRRVLAPVIPAPSEPRARGPREKTCWSSCLS
jgi:hypothetical protein